MDSQQIITYWKQCGSRSDLVGVVPADLCHRIDEIIQEAAPQAAGGRAERVTVIAVDPIEAMQHQAPRGKAKPVEQWQTFPSAVAASLHLGFKTNSVALGLGEDARRLEEEATEKYGPAYTVRLRPQTTRRGVTMQYEKDVPE